MKLSKLLALFLCVALLAALPENAVALNNGVQTGSVQNSYSDLHVTANSTILIGVESLEQGRVDWKVQLTEASPGANLAVVALQSSSDEAVSVQMNGTIVEQDVGEGHVDSVAAGYFMLLFTLVPSESSEGFGSDSSAVFDLTVSGNIEEDHAYPPSLRIMSDCAFQTYGYPRSIPLKVETQPGNLVYFGREQVLADANGMAVRPVILGGLLEERIEMKALAESGHGIVAYVTVVNHWVTENPATPVYLSRRPLLLVNVPDTSIIDTEASVVEIDDQPAELYVSSSDSLAFSYVAGTPSTSLDYGSHNVLVALYSKVDTPGRDDKLLDVVSWDFEIPAKRQARLWPGETVCIVNDEEFNLDAAPFRDPATGSTMLPLRFVGDLMGAQVAWQGSDQTAVFTLGEKTVQLSIGKKTALVNGKQVTLAAPPANIAGRTMVPLRFVSESLGAQVSWDPATSTIQVEVMLDEPEMTVG